MKKTNFNIIVMIMCFALVVTSFGCAKKDEKEKQQEVEFKFEEEFMFNAEKIGTVKGNNISVHRGGVIYKDDNGNYGVISFDGKYDSGAIYGQCQSVGSFFKVSDDVEMDPLNPATLNTWGLVNGKGELVIPKKYALFGVLSERYIKVYEVTGKAISEDETLIRFSSSMFPSVPSSDDILLKGNWAVYDIENKSLVSGVSGTKTTVVDAYGDNIVFYNDANEKVYINTKGTDMPDNLSFFADGSYKFEAREGTVNSKDDKTLFTYDLAGYIPKYKSGDYYVASKIKEGETKYVLLDVKGNKVSAEFDGEITIYGELIFCNGKIYNYDGKNVLKGTYDRVYFDSLTKGVWVLEKDDTYTMINSEGIVIHQVKKEANKIAFSTDKFVLYDTKGEKTYSYAEKKYSLDGYSVAPWLIKKSAENSRSDIVSVISGESLIEGYISYSFTEVIGGKIYVCAIYKGGADVFEITANVK